MVIRDGDREAQEVGGGIGNGPGEFEVGVKGVSKADELFKLLVGAQGSTGAVINVAKEEEQIHGARVRDVLDRVFGILKGEREQPQVVVHVGTNDV
eukprot:g27732.t1